MRNIFALILFFSPFVVFSQAAVMDVEESVSTVQQKYTDAWKKVGKESFFVIQVASLSGENSGTQAQQIVNQINDFFSASGTTAVAYTTFMEPNHKVRVGFFNTRRAAYATLLDIQGMYPNAFVTHDRRNINELLK